MLFCSEMAAVEKARLRTTASAVWCRNSCNSAVKKLVPPSFGGLTPCAASTRSRSWSGSTMRALPLTGLLAGGTWSSASAAARRIASSAAAGVIWWPL